MVTFAFMFVVCFFFLDMELVYRKAGMTSAAKPVLLQQDFNMASSATQESSDDSAAQVSTPFVHVTAFKQPIAHNDMSSIKTEASGITIEPSSDSEDGGPNHVEVEATEQAFIAVPEVDGDEIGGDNFTISTTQDTSTSKDDEDPIIKSKLNVRERPQEARSLAGCDITQGRWVFDNVTHPLYRTKNCPFADPGFRCEENGRPDKEFMSYRWHPNDCDLPRFCATDILERLRGQRMVFVGDSLGRNNWESMLCMLAEGVTNKSRIYEVNGEPITKHSGKLVYKFEDYNCTVEYYRDPFLVPQGRPPRNSPANVSCSLKVDRVSYSTEQWRHAEIIIFNAGHWWSEHKIFHQGCKFQVGDKLMDYDLRTGLKKALHTWAAWLEENLDTKKSQVFWLSYPTVHFRGGTWNRGGHCHQEKRPLTEEEARNEWQTPWMNEIVKESFMANIKKKLDAVTYLDITTATNYRPDGHGALYTWDTKKFGLKPRNRQDCSHFCLPGVPDTWSQFVLASLLARGRNTWAQPVRLCDRAKY